MIKMKMSTGARIAAAAMAMLFAAMPAQAIPRGGALQAPERPPQSIERGARLGSKMHRPHKRMMRPRRYMMPRRSHRFAPRFRCRVMPIWRGSI